MAMSLHDVTRSRSSSLRRHMLLKFKSILNLMLIKKFKYSLVTPNKRTVLFSEGVPSLYSIRPTPVALYIKPTIDIDLITHPFKRTVMRFVGNQEEERC